MHPNHLVGRTLIVIASSSSNLATRFDSMCNIFYMRGRYVVTWQCPRVALPPKRPASAFGGARRHLDFSALFFVL